MMRLIIRLALLLICSVSFAQTNLLDTSTWTVGTGSALGFNRTGTDSENIREMGVGPHGSSVLLWKGITDGTATNDDGGWISNIAIDPSKTYRCTVWMKKTNSNDGHTSFGVQAKDNSGSWALSSLQDVTLTYASFHNGGMPALDNWYLFVGYIHDNTFTGTTSIGGVYDSATGAKILDLTDKKFQSTASELINKLMLHRGTPNIADALYFYDPTIYEVNGQEPTIQELIDGPLDTQAPTAPTLSSASQTDTTVDLSWTAATDDVVVTGYKVYKGGVLESTLGNVLSYQVTGLTASTAYNFTVTALDAAGNESVVSNAINITTNTSSGGGSGNWTLNNQDVYYNTGNVGIGTNTPDEKLTVKGSIHSEEVRVDLSVPAPDYVFETNYNLTPLEQLRLYIIQNKHLPNIPTAKKMEANGVELGTMNMKLLEKIEELTLYILEQESRIKKLEKIIK